MYYRLKDGFAFRGWKGLPFMVEPDMKPGMHRPDPIIIMDKQAYLDLLKCDGVTDLSENELTSSGAMLLQDMKQNGVIEESETSLAPLSSKQTYVFYPAPYIKTAVWAITGRCNCRCRHCLVSAPLAKHSQLSMKDCLHIIDELAEAGIKEVTFTGGEPLMRQDLPQLIQTLAEKDIRIGYIITNGMLVNDDLLDLLERYGHHSAFQVSFDGKGHHDWLRGIDGAEEDTVRAIRTLTRRGYSVSCAMCIHRGNKDCLRDTVNYLAGMGVSSLAVTAPQSSGIWKEYEEEYALSDAEAERIYLDYLPQYFADGAPLLLSLGGIFHYDPKTGEYSVPFERGERGEQALDGSWSCATMRYTPFISSEGRLLPCMQFVDSPLDPQFPSLLEMPLAEAASDSLYHRVGCSKLRDIRAHNAKCQSCEHFDLCCGGCRASAVAAGEDYLGIDPQTCSFFTSGASEATRKEIEQIMSEYGRTA